MSFELIQPGFGKVQAKGEGASPSLEGTVVARGRHDVTERARIRSVKGGVLISMLASMLAISVLGVAVISLTKDAVQSRPVGNGVSRAYYLAESGLRYAQQVHCSEGWRHGRIRSLSMQGGEQVEILRIADNFWAVASVDLGTAKEGRSRVPMSVSLCGGDSRADPVLDAGVLAGDELEIDDDTVIEGDVVVLGNDVKIKGDVVGSVFAEKVELEAGGTVVGDVYVSGSSSVGGASNPIEIRSSGSVFISGSAVVVGVVYAAESIEVEGGARIEGSAYAGGAVSVGSSSSITGESFSNATTYLETAICPDLSLLDSLELPEPTEFTAGGPDIDLPKGRSNSQTYFTVSPGSYDDLETNRDSQYTHLYFGAGDYYFDKGDLGSKLNLYFDLSGSDDVRVFVEDDIDIDKELVVFVSTDGENYLPMLNVSQPLAARVYWESHGKFELKRESQWFGSVFTPYDEFKVERDSLLIGSFLGGEETEIKDSTAIQVGANYLAGN